MWSETVFTGKFQYNSERNLGRYGHSSTYFNILFPFLTKANIQNIPYHTAESLSLFESIKLQCQESTLICLFADVKVIQITDTQNDFRMDFTVIWFNKFITKLKTRCLLLHLLFTCTYNVLCILRELYVQT
jgi:hypothetical protein